jgi:hypothetical protein
MTAAIYLLTPVWIIKTQRLQKVTPTEAPELYRELHDLCAKAALPSHPTFVWNPLAAGMPFVFGWKGRYYVALSATCVTHFFYRDVAAFRAIIFHELGHLRNGDADKASMTLSAWKAFLLANVLPAVIICFLTDRNRATELIMNAIVSVILIGFSGLAVLRAREYYADVRASVWDGTRVNIDRVLAALPAMTGGIWLRYFRFHPDPNERRKVVEDTSRLFPLSRWVAIGLGLVAWMSDAALSIAGFPFLPEDPWEMLLAAMAMAVIVPAFLLLFVVGVVGIAVWRGAFAALVLGNRPSRGAGRLGVAVGMSYLAFQIFVFLQISLTRDNVVRSFGFIKYFEIQLVVSLALILACFLVFRWVAAAASAWFGVALASRSPSPVVALTVGVALLLVTGAMFSSMFIGAALLLTSFPDAPSIIGPLVYMSGSPVFVGLIAAWGFPLIGWISHREDMPARFPEWVFLDNHSVTLPEQKQLHLRSALMTGMGAGIAGCLLWVPLIFYRYLPTGLEEPIKAIVSWLKAGTLPFGGGSIIVIPTAIFQAMSAGIAAARAERLNALCGLFAASVSGCIMSIGTVGMLDIASGQRTQLSSLLWSVGAFTSLGTLITLPAVIVAAWLRRLFCGYRSLIRNKL